jgi:hypothetical protein
MKRLLLKIMYLPIIIIIMSVESFVCLDLYYKN